MNNETATGHLTVDDVRFESPGFSPEQLGQIARNFYGISGEQKDLGGERDQNTRLSLPDGRKYVLKVSGALEDPRTVDFQLKALLHIQACDPDLPVPRMVRGKQGAWVHQFQSGEETFQVRLLTYLSGMPYSSGPYPSSAGLTGIGAFLAGLGRALSDFTHPASSAFVAWDIGSDLPFSTQFRELVPHEVRSLCWPLLDRLESETSRALATLRRQVIHQDAHGSNLLRHGVDSEEVAGMIDFGDMVEGPLINDLAICVSHFMERGKEPVRIARSLCEGYNSVVHLHADETDVLLDMVIKRHILTLQLYEFRRLNMPHSPPKDLEEKPRIIASLQRLAALDRPAFQADLRSVCS